MVGGNIDDPGEPGTCLIDPKAEVGVGIASASKLGGVLPSTPTQSIFGNI